MILVFPSQGTAETASAQVHSHSTCIWRRTCQSARRLSLWRAWPGSSCTSQTAGNSCSSIFQTANRWHKDKQGTIATTQQSSGALPGTDRHRRWQARTAAAPAGAVVEGAPSEGMVPGEPGQPQVLSRRSPQRGSGGGLSRSGLLVAQHVLAEKLSDDAKDVYDEYDRLRRGTGGGTVHAALSGANELRNRYSNVLPFDANRVRLQLQRQRSDYINASLLESPPDAAPGWRYIAAQGPKSATVADFLQMVYEQQSAVIVMLTRTIESGSMRKCADYFPERLGESMAAGSWGVACSAVHDVDADVCRRDLTLTPPPKLGPPRTVAHFHYHAWPDHGVPSSTRPLRDLVASVRALQQAAPHAGPPVVHCSAGIGRTGAFCCVDIALARLRCGDYGAAVSAAELRPVVTELRRQRAGMVQTAEQYAFCYQAVKDEVDQMLGASTQNGSAHPAR